MNAEKFLKAATEAARLSEKYDILVDVSMNALDGDVYVALYFYANEKCAGSELWYERCGEMEEKAKIVAKKRDEYYQNKQA